jgi:hypothetical protein
MPCQSDGTLADELGLLYSLPNYVDKSALIKPVIINKWEKHSLVKEVLAGRTTFEKTVMPLVESYRNGKCYSSEFASMAAEIEQKLKNIFNLVMFRSLSGGCGGLVIISEEMLTWRMNSISNLRKWLMSRWSILEPDQFSERKRFAEKILEKAKFLDEIINPLVR